MFNVPSFIAPNKTRAQFPWNASSTVESEGVSCNFLLLTLPSTTGFAHTRQACLRSLEMVSIVFREQCVGRSSLLSQLCLTSVQEMSLWSFCHQLVFLFLKHLEENPVCGALDSSQSEELNFP